jgi:hypothetical protein
MEVIKMTKRSIREWEKKSMLTTCEKLGIALPVKANIRQVRSAMDEYYEKAVVVHDGDGVVFRQTDKPTAEYTIEFTLQVSHAIKAESEEAACKWMKENATDYYRPDIGETTDTGSYEFIDVYKNEN